jgi:hypothetical protein
MTLLQTGPNAFAGTVHLTSGPPLGAVPFDHARGQEMDVGPRR